jgi:hypothetical protein
MPSKKPMRDSKSSNAAQAAAGAEDDNAADVLTYEDKQAAYKAGQFHAYRFLPPDNNREYKRCVASDSARDTAYADEFKRGHKSVDQTKDVTIKRFAKDEAKRLSSSDRSDKSKKRFLDAYNRVSDDKKEFFLKTAKGDVGNDALIAGIVKDDDVAAVKDDADKEAPAEKKKAAKGTPYIAGRNFALSLQPFGSGRNNPRNIEGSEYAKEYKRGYDSVKQGSDKTIKKFGTTEGKWFKRSSTAGKPNTKRFQTAYARVPDDKKETFLAAANEVIDDRAILETIIRGKEDAAAVEGEATTAAAAAPASTPKRLTRKREKDDDLQADDDANDANEKKEKGEKTNKRRKVDQPSSGSSFSSSSNSSQHQRFFSSSAKSSSSSSSSNKKSPASKLDRSSPLAKPPKPAAPRSMAKPPAGATSSLSTAPRAART